MRSPHLIQQYAAVQQRSAVRAPLHVCRQLPWASFPLQACALILHVGQGFSCSFTLRAGGLCASQLCSGLRESGNGQGLCSPWESRRA